MIGARSVWSGLCGAQTASASPTAYGRLTGDPVQPSVSVQMKPFTGAYLLHDCFTRMSVFAVRRSFIPFAFDRESHDLLGRYARREREASLQQYNVTYTCSLTVPANVALLLLSTHSLGALHASGGVPAACAYSIGKVVRHM
jgi:hypothetical protein